MTVDDWIRLFALEEGERILALDETRVGRRTRDAAEANGVRVPTQVAVIPLMGALRPRGAGGMEGFRARVNEAAGNPDVGAIVLDVDSPGGTYAGTPETGAVVRAAAQAKPVIAVVDSLAASAAYWICAQATQIVVSPSADVGSIGVISMHMDLSEMLAKDGIKTTIIRSVPFKAEGSMFEPLTADAQANIESEVASAHDQFIRAVAEGRKTSLTKVNTEFGKGRTVGAQRAVDLGMADRIGTLADVLGGMRTKHAIRRRSAAAFA